MPFRGMIVVAALAIGVLMTIMTPADKVWHRLSLEPFATWLAVDGLLTIAAVVAGFVVQPFISGSLAMGIVLVGLIGNLACVMQIHRYLDATICAPAVHQRSCNRAIQTMAIWDLLDFVTALPNKRFIFLDWGIRNQALLMTREPDRVIELQLTSYWEGVSGLTFGSEGADIFAKEYFRPDGRTFFVLHGPEYTCIPATRDAFFNLVKSRGVPLRQSGFIKEDGAIAFEVWEVAL